MRANKSFVMRWVVFYKTLLEVTMVRVGMEGKRGEKKKEKGRKRKKRTEK